MESWRQLSKKRQDNEKTPICRMPERNVLIFYPMLSRTSMSAETAYFPFAVHMASFKSDVVSFFLDKVDNVIRNISF